MFIIRNNPGTNDLNELAHFAAVGLLQQLVGDVLPGFLLRDPKVSLDDVAALPTIALQQAIGAAG